jgi:prepilin-type N-terminal cleavage/methylation domain-containing protein
MIRRSRTSKRSDGLTLLELMIAMVILSIGLLGLLTMQIEAMKSGRIGKHVSDAARIGQDQMEQLQNQSWLASAPTGWTVPTPFVGPRVDAINLADTLAAPTGQSIDQVFNVSWRIVAVGGITDLRRMDVRVTWVEPGDLPGMPPRRFAISSMRYNP